MTTFPDKLRNRAAGMIAASADLVTAAHVRISALGSQVSSLTPGDWELVTLSAGWSNVPGYIPAQVRIVQNGMSQVVGHIQGGTVSDGTVIGTLTSGYYNTVHSHTFTVNSVTGAAASSQAGTLSSGAGALSDLAGDLSSGAGTLTDLAGNLTSGTVSGSAFGSLNVANTALTLHSGAVSVPTPLTLHSGAVSVTSGTTATPVNKNSPTITLGTSGQLTIANVDPNVTQLSFSQLLPLVTS